MPRYIAQFSLSYTGTLDMGEATDKDSVPNIDTIRARIARELQLDTDMPESYTIGSTRTDVQLQQVPTEAELEAARAAQMQNMQRGPGSPSGLVVPGMGPRRV